MGGEQGRPERLDMGICPDVAEPVVVDGGAVRAGTASWADRSLVGHGGFYPKKTMTASQRLAYYASRFSVTEVTTTFRFPPTPEVARQWVERTPDGFRFDVRAWSLLTGCPTLPDSLWPDLLQEVTPTARDSRRLYPAHLSADGQAECWARFAHALAPLRESGRLGAVLAGYPSWFTPRPETWAELAALPSRLPGIDVAVELRHGKWFEGPQADETLEWLEEHGVGFVCVDGPGAGVRAAPAVVAATADLAVVRFNGRRAVEADPWTWPYRYQRSELAAWVPLVTELAGTASEVHLLFANCAGTDAVDGASTLLELVRSYPAQ